MLRIRILGSGRIQAHDGDSDVGNPNKTKTRSEPVANDAFLPTMTVIVDGAGSSSLVFEFLMLKV